MAGSELQHVVANLGLGVALSPRRQLQAQVGNLFDMHYKPAALLGTAAFDANGN